MTKLSARDKLLNAAADLFYEKGIAATGIDAVIRRAKVAKMSLYNNFESKSALVTAYIAHRHQQWLDLYAKRACQAPNSWERILAVFDAYQDHAEFEYENGFRGCGLLNAAAEMPANSPEREAVKTHKDEVKTIIINELKELPLINNSAQFRFQLAEHLCFLLEGSISLAGLAQDTKALQRARAMADNLIESAL